MWKIALRIGRTTRRKNKMAKLKDKKWSAESDAGDEIKFTSTVTVDGDGIFFMSVPEYLVPIMNSLQEKAAESWVGYDEKNVRHSRGKFRVIGRSYQECMDLIGKGLEEFLICEIIKEPVIAYTFISTCHYGKDRQGKIWPNGYDDQGAVICQKAIDCNFFPLYEIEFGKTTLSYDPEAKGKKVPMSEWLKTMGKARHLTKPENKELLESTSKQEEPAK